MLLKICGMKDPEQMVQVNSELLPDIMGFIFYPKSPRYVGNMPSLPVFPNQKMKKAGVFVKENIETILETGKKYNLDFIQLHSDEDPDYVRKVSEHGFKTLKAFRVDENFDMRLTRNFEGAADYFLFDTKVKEYGGGGKSFDWKIMEQYEGQTPWFLSGGLSLSNIGEIKNYDLKNLAGIDVNSGFEISPGAKDIEKLKTLTRMLFEKTL